MRVEKRAATICHDVHGRRKRHGSPSLSATGFSQRLADDAQSIDTRCHRPSAKPSAEPFGQIFRAYWARTLMLHRLRRLEKP